jgi:hypothetical protein
MRSGSSRAGPTGKDDGSFLGLFGSQIALASFAQGFEKSAERMPTMPGIAGARILPAVKGIGVPVVTPVTQWERPGTTILTIVKSKTFFQFTFMGFLLSGSPKLPDSPKNRPRLSQDASLGVGWGKSLTLFDP